MLHPDFQLSQNDNEVIITIRAPLAHLKDTEISILENVVMFYSKPYYLRIHLPGDVEEESESDRAVFDSESESFLIRARKKRTGEHFSDLNMISKLLAAPSPKPAVPKNLIEVLSSSDQAPSELLDEGEFDWFLDQAPSEDSPPSVLLEAAKYGFARGCQELFKTSENELLEVVDLPDPDRTAARERRKLREKDEVERFNPDHYLADLHEDELAQEMLSHRPTWMDQYVRLRSGEAIESIVQFEEEERYVLKNLPLKNYLLDNDLLPSVYLGLLDLLFAFAYDVRITGGEHCVESAWNIVKLSPTLSWFDEHSNLKSVLTSSYRRALVYPLCRHFGVCCKIRKDLLALLALGRSRILQCLLAIRSILAREGYDLLNRLYVTDYCVWIQSASDRVLESLYSNLLKVNLTKEDVGLNLPVWEKMKKSSD